MYQVQLPPGLKAEYPRLGPAILGKDVDCYSTPQLEATVHDSYIAGRSSVVFPSTQSEMTAFVFPLLLGFIIGRFTKKEKIVFTQIPLAQAAANRGD